MAKQKKNQVIDTKPDNSLAALAQAMKDAIIVQNDAKRAARDAEHAAIEAAHALEMAHEAAGLAGDAFDAAVEQLTDSDD